MENKEIPGNLLRKWEISATEQNLSQSEFIIFIRERQKEYFDSLVNSEKPKIMENGQLTDYGKNVAVEYYHSMNKIQRAITLSKVDFMTLEETLKKKGYNNDICYEIISSYDLLRERMSNLRISKEEMKKYRLDFSEVRKMYFSAKYFLAANYR